MGTNNKDVVYILKNDIQPDELRYSLRSVGQNFPHGKVWFFGGCPKGITPDVYVEYHQQGRTKWEKATSTYRAICNTEEVSEDFWLFNDDFYILEKVSDLPMMYRGTLAERVKDLVDKHGAITPYCSQLIKTEEALRAKNLDTLDYAIHTPMLINKKKALETLDAFPTCPMFRSLYGNYTEAGGIQTDDVKIYDTFTLPKEGQTLLSTSDTSFRTGRVGKYIRDRFTEPSRWETSC